MRLCTWLMIGLLVCLGQASGADARELHFPPILSDAIAYLRSVAAETHGLFVGSCRQTDTHIGVTSIYVVLPRDLKEGYVVEVNDEGSTRYWVNMASFELHGTTVELTDMTEGGEQTADIMEKAAQAILAKPMKYEISFDAALNSVPTNVCPRLF